MSSELYDQIVKAKEAITREKREKEEAEAIRLRERKRAEEKAREEVEKKIDQEKRQALEKLEATTGIVESIFSEIMENDPTIRKAPLKEIITQEKPQHHHPEVNLELRWGTKFELTPAEEEKIRKYKYRRPLVFTNIPDEIVSKDYSYIRATVGENSVLVNGELFNSEEFRQNPQIAAPTIAKGLLQPHTLYRVFRKGEDYFQEKHSRESYSDPWNSCCCS